MTNLRHLIAAASLAGASPAVAQQQPMAELFGQPVTVTTNRITNTLYFEADGRLRILTPNATLVPANWFMQGQNLCISTGAASECWPYQPFEVRQPRTMESSCHSISTWTAQNINGGRGRGGGERGR